MESSNSNRLSRLSSILIQLQTKRLLQAADLAKKFQVSKRTIYRDIKALEDAGVPIFTEEGKGYRILEGYNIPPIMFNEEQANALILAEQLVLRNKDASFIKDYSAAIEKIKAILRYSQKDKVDILTQRTQYKEVLEQKRSSNYLSTLQQAITNFYLTQINYTNKDGSRTTRLIEPFALLSTENWYLIAWCRLRNDFRFFRLDRMEKVMLKNQSFEPHKMSLQEYFDKYHKT